MKGRTFYFVVGFLALAFGIFAATTKLGVKPSFSDEEAVSGGVPDVEYCELKNYPEKFDGKILRVSSNLYWFMHGYFFEDLSCPGEGARTAVSLYKPRKEKLSRYLDQLGVTVGAQHPLKIVAVGRFRYASPAGRSDLIEDRTSLHYEIYKIESAAE